MDNVNFTARYIDTLSVMKKNANKQYASHKVILAEIESKNKQDMRALKDVCDIWDGNYFGSDILDTAGSTEKLHKTLVVTDQPKEQISDSLNPKRIIGLANIDYSPYRTNIYHIETIPKSVSEDYNLVGTSMINHIKDNTTQIHLFCPSPDVIDDFYKNLGFKHKYPDDKRMIYYGLLRWDKDISFPRRICTFIKSKLFT